MKVLRLLSSTFAASFHLVALLSNSALPFRNIAAVLGRLALVPANGEAFSINDQKNLQSENGVIFSKAIDGTFASTSLMEIAVIDGGLAIRNGYLSYNSQTVFYVCADERGAIARDTLTFDPVCEESFEVGLRTVFEVQKLANIKRFINASSESQPSHLCQKRYLNETSVSKSLHNSTHV